MLFLRIMIRKHYYDGFLILKRQEAFALHIFCYFLFVLLETRYQFIMKQEAHGPYRSPVHINEYIAAKL